jgi:hypothetical protein
MIQRETAEPVIKVLRRITLDGQLSTDEVWALARWLNTQSEGIRKNWPAIELVKFLNNAFDDGVLTHGEMEDLAATISAIEQIWNEFSPPIAEEFSAQTAPEASPSSREKALLPVCDYQTTVEADGGSNSYFVDLQKHTCTCPDWTENRADFAARDYRRFCRHMPSAFERFIEWQQAPLDSLFTAFAHDHKTRGRGASVDDFWEMANLGGARVLFGASLAHEWVNLYAPVAGVYERFAYNRRTRRWAYGEAPGPLSASVRGLFHNNLATAEIATAPQLRA